MGSEPTLLELLGEEATRLDISERGHRTNGDFHAANNCRDRAERLRAAAERLRSEMEAAKERTGVVDEWARNSVVNVLCRINGGPLAAKEPR